MWRESLHELPHQLPFIPRKAWLREVFGYSAPRRELSALALRFSEPDGLIAATFLVQHAALGTRISAPFSATQISMRRRELSEIARSLMLPWPRGVFLAAKLSGVDAPRFRQSCVRIRSEANPLATQFHPPLPGHLKTACEELGVQLNAANGALPPLERALIAAMVFLTLHPFADGNGRTARHIFFFVDTEERLHRSGLPHCICWLLFRELAKASVGSQGPEARRCESSSRLVCELLCLGCCGLGANSHPAAFRIP